MRSYSSLPTPNYTMYLRVSNDTADKTTTGLWPFNYTFQGFRPHCSNTTSTTLSSRPDQDLPRINPNTSRHLTPNPHQRPCSDSSYQNYHPQPATTPPSQILLTLTPRQPNSCASVLVNPTMADLHAAYGSTPTLGISQEILPIFTTEARAASSPGSRA